MQILMQVTARTAVQQSADTLSPYVVMVQLKSTFLRSYKQKMNNTEGNFTRRVRGTDINVARRLRSDKVMVELLQNLHLSHSASQYKPLSTVHT